MQEVYKMTLKKTHYDSRKGRGKKMTHFSGGGRKENRKHTDQVCKVSKSELLMALPNAKGKLKPFPLEFCL